MLDKHLLGEYSQGKKGPLFVCLAGVHGNEHAGIHAFKRVLAHLKKTNPNFLGELVGIAGNLPAINTHERFIEKDLNRQWTPKQMEYVKSIPKRQLTNSEDIQQRNLLILFERLMTQTPHSPIVLMDMHTMSAQNSLPFAIANNTPLSKELATNLGVPALQGVENIIKGTTLHYFTEMFMSAFGFEAGQHDDPQSIERLEAAIWMTLHKVNSIAPHNVPDFQNQRFKLSNIGEGMPELVEFIYRHGIVPSDEFTMLPGFQNFQKVKKGQLLAHDKTGEVRAPYDGFVLMPLYQKQGEDGFFLGQAVKKSKSKRTKLNPYLV